MGKPMTPERRAAIGARAAAATPGPWGWPHVNALAGGFADGFDGEWTLVAAIHDAGPVSPADAAFIAHARTDIPDLLAEIGRLTALLADDPPYHIIDIREHGFALSHPTACRPLFDCKVTAVCDVLRGPPAAMGRYRVDLDDAGNLRIGEAVDG